MTDSGDQQSSNTSGARTAGERPLIVAIAGSDSAPFDRLVPELPTGRGIAFIIVSSGDGPGVPLELARLQALTSLTVVTASAGLTLEADHIYVAPGGAVLTCRDRELSSTPREPHSLPVDELFRSLAEVDAERTAVILLAGLRADGSVGAAQLKAAGGFVIVQAPLNALEASSPEYQLLTMAADLVLPLPRLIGALLHYFRPSREAGDRTSITSIFDAEALAPILGVVSATTGHDFSRYKRSTVSRRVQRRMRVHGLDKPSEYAQLLEARPAEAELLFNEMLIGVTRFFRDPETYAALGAALDDYLRRLPENRDVRVWVPACSTGEEAYSVAIVIHESMQRTKRNHSVKMFASDVDSKAIEFARCGRYPRGIAADVSPERLERFFVQEDDTYRINKETRERIVFAPHNVTRDPPFTHINLLSCRNLLIYLEPELQQQVLNVFEYALESGGLLLLGSSESLGAVHSSFELLDKRAKLFAHRALHPRRTLSLPIDPLRADRFGRREDRMVRGVRHSASVLAEQLLMSEFVPPAAIVAPSGDIVFIHGRTGKFLEPAVGEPSTNLFEMAREGLRLELPAAVRSAHHSRQPVVRRGLDVRTNGRFESVTLAVKPLNDPEPLRGLLLVTFQIEEPSAERGQPTPSEHTSNLEAELHYVRSTLQGMIEDLESSNEELKSMNEELQSTNEEVQSSNEELSTSREELQSLNEELQTLNDELAQRNALLSQSNDDMHNLLSSVQVATVFVDAQLNVKRFTAPARNVFRLRESDIGRPVSDLVLNLDYETLVEDAQEVLRTLVFAEREVQTASGEWRQMRILPYRTANNVIDGLIITVTDIHHLKGVERDRDRQRALLEELLASMPLPLLLLDDSFRIVAASVDFGRRFGITEPKLVGKALASLAPGWRHPALAERLAALSRGEPCPILRLAGTLGTGYPVDVLVHPRRLERPEVGVRYLLLFQEVTPSLPQAITLD